MTTDHNATINQPPDETTPTYRHEFDPAPESVAEILVTAVADCTETAVNELPPLYRAINPDALEALFQPSPTWTNRPANGVLRFDYAGCVVRIAAAGELTLAPKATK